MENTQGSSLGYLLYDPYILGYDSSFFKTMGGVPTISADHKLVFNVAYSQSLFSMMGGVLKLALTIPAAPTLGAARRFGLITKARETKDAAYFNIAGTVFTAETFDKDGTQETTVITWNSVWTNTEAVFEIRFDKNRTIFLIDGITVADHYTSVPRKTMLPVYIGNDNSDNLTLSYLEVREARDILFLKGQMGLATENGNVLIEDAGCNKTLVNLEDGSPTVVTTADARLLRVYVNNVMSNHAAEISSPGTDPLVIPAQSSAGTSLPFDGAFFEGGITVTPAGGASGKLMIFWRGAIGTDSGVSPSSSVSASRSPSLSPSSSKSPSLSPSSSESPSVSPSLSPSSSISPSISPSLSPSSSISPSISPSLSPSSSLSPSASESPSNSSSESPSLSPSTSISPSLSPSSSLSPSTSPSLSPSSSKSPSLSPSSSISASLSPSTSLSPSSSESPSPSPVI